MARQPAQLLAGLNGSAPVRTVEEIIEFNERHRDKEMPYFGQETMIKAEAKGVITQVLVENAKPVEFGQPLFKLRPT